MATETQIGGGGELFVGEDKIFKHVVMAAPASAGVVIDFSTWTLKLVVRRNDNSADPAILEKTATLSGTFNADPNLNTLVATVVLTDTEMQLFSAKGTGGKAATYRYSWKRTDDGFETITGFGDWVVEEATQR